MDINETKADRVDKVLRRLSYCQKIPISKGSRIQKLEIEEGQCKGYNVKVSKMNQERALIVGAFRCDMESIIVAAPPHWSTLEGFCQLEGN